MDSLEPASWKQRASWLGAVPLAALFAVSGVWKITDPIGWAVRISQLQVPHQASLAAALAVGIAETVGAVWILMPSYRRWGAAVIGGLLAAFLVYFALHYGALRGADCSCFPWVKRVVGPGFFAGDLAMLALAALAGKWARRPAGFRPAVAILATVVVFAGVSYGVETQQQSGTRAPASVTVNGRPYAIGHGKYFLFFFHPECSHCYNSAKHMAQLHWRDTTVIAVPVEVAEEAPAFLEETGLKAVVSTDFASLRTVFGYTAYPFGVAIENSREKGSVSGFEEGEPDATLKKLGFID